MTSIALIVAAGSGSRSGLSYPKQYLKMGSQTVLEKSVRAFLEHPEIAQVQVVIAPADQDLYEQCVGHLDLPAPIMGGSSRQESVLNGLLALQDHPPTNILIHDAARPFVDAKLISRCLEGLEKSPVVLPAMAVNDTVKTIDGEQVTGTIDRNKLVFAQTPQCFRYADILKAHQTYKGQLVTDDIALAELAGIEVTWVEGAKKNMKITTAEDVDRVTHDYLTDIRTGFGYDVHVFDENSELWLGGIKIPHKKGLKGHSDADVALHALTDAILGAIGEGDIGTHFPPSDSRWKGARSDQFLRHANELVKQRGGIIGNVDLTIICEAPKISPHREEMKTRISQILGIEVDRVSVKGTTTEKLGFTGREEGIAAKAVATVRLPI